MGFGHRMLSIERGLRAASLDWALLLFPNRQSFQLQPKAGGCLSGAIMASSFGGPHLGLGAKGSEVRGAGPADPTS